jgi:hypothetical protein
MAIAVIKDSRERQCDKTDGGLDSLQTASCNSRETDLYSFDTYYLHMILEQTVEQKSDVLYSNVIDDNVVRNLSFCFIVDGTYCRSCAV